MKSPERLGTESWRSEKRTLGRGPRQEAEWKGGEASGGSAEPGFLDVQRNLLPTLVLLACDGAGPRAASPEGKQVLHGHPRHSLLLQHRAPKMEKEPNTPVLSNPVYVQITLAACSRKGK